MTRGAVQRRRGIQGQRALRFHLGAHGQQHAAHIRVLNNGHAGRIGRAHGTALHPIARVLHRLLVGAFRYRQTFDAHAQACVVHHGEHIVQALVGLANQITDRAALISEAHHGGGAAVDAQLVLQRYATHVVACAQATVCIDQEFGHDEQGDAFHPGRRVRQAGQHQMDDVVRHIVLAPGDEDFLAADAIAAVSLRHRLAAHLSQI